MYKRTENPHLTDADVQRLLIANGAYRSDSLLKAKKHLAQLNNSDQTFPAVVLLGDDLIEGFETEGDQDLFISDKWPPLDLRDWWTDPQLDDTVFNAGVSGDKFANIIHRLVGDMDYDDPNLPGLAGLRPILKSRKVKLWVVHAGTNNLSPPYGLSNEQVGLLRLILDAILRISSTQTAVLLTGLFYREDIGDDLVDKANDKLQRLSQDLNDKLGAERIVWFPRPPGVHVHYLKDHMHLDKYGYRSWTSWLMPKMMELLKQHGEN